MMLVEYDLQRLLKSLVAVEMVEVQPALLRLWGQLRQTFIQRRPVAQGLQTYGPSLLQRLVEIEHTLIVHIMVHVDIHPRGLVVQEKPSCLCDTETLTLGIHHDDADGKRGFQQALQGIVGEVGLFADLPKGKSVVRLVDQFHDAPLHHDPCRLEHHRPPGDDLCIALSLPCRLQLFCIYFL